MQGLNEQMMEEERRAAELSELENSTQLITVYYRTPRILASQSIQLRYPLTQELRESASLTFQVMLQLIALLFFLS